MECSTLFYFGTVSSACCYRSYKLRALNRGRAFDLCAFTSGRLPDLWCWSPENPGDLFVGDLGRASDLDFFR